MLTAFHIFALLLVSVAMALSLAHALELPGKMRLSEDDYVAVQPIYYPGFTVGGFLGDFGGLVALAILLFLLPFAGASFWWAAASFALLLSSNLIYWLVTHPVNGFWLKDTQMTSFGEKFFSMFSSRERSDWTKLRDTWEYSHVARACFAMASFLAAAISLSLE